MKDKISYSAAFEELRQIVDEMEKGEIGVDVLSEKVKRASVLIQVCREKLRSTEMDVKKILADLDELQQD
jgi:exodeoxyribonuclease VII small subunit